MRNELQEAIHQDGLWERIASTPIPNDLFKQAARNGWSDINPVDDVDLFDDYTDRVRETMEVRL